jgi:23S rRNA pseudouridine955/2504/2580 synthase
MSTISKRKSDVQHVEIEPEQGQRRLDNFLFGRLRDVPKSRVYRMIRTGEVRVNGGRVRPEYRLQPGDRLRLPPLVRDEERTPRVPPGVAREIMDAVIHEDPELLVLNKPCGIPVHSGTRRSFGVIDALRAVHPAGAALQLVHRLDRDTSGCLLVAKNAASLRRLHGQIRDGEMTKQYVALLRGRLPGELEMDESLDTHARRGGGRVVKVGAGKASLTRFKPVRHFRNATLANATILTGRTHQIRVHAAAAGHPVAGDGKYGDRGFNRELRELGLKRLFLHASRVRIPGAGGRLSSGIDAPLPQELRDFLGRLEG